MRKKTQGNYQLFTKTKYYSGVKQLENLQIFVKSAGFCKIFSKNNQTGNQIPQNNWLFINIDSLEVY